MANYFLSRQHGKMFWMFQEALIHHSHDTHWSFGSNWQTVVCSNINTPVTPLASNLILDQRSPWNLYYILANVFPCWSRWWLNNWPLNQTSWFKAFTLMQCAVWTTCLFKYSLWKKATLPYHCGKLLLPFPTPLFAEWPTSTGLKAMLHTLGKQLHMYMKTSETYF